MNISAALAGILPCRRYFRLTWILSAALSFAPAAHAWNDTGHMVAALIAHDTLTVGQRESAGALLRRHPRFAADFEPNLPRGLRQASAAEQNRWYFAFAATWPDLARRFGHVQPLAERASLVDRYHHGSWHYINLPIYLRPSDAGKLRRGTPSMTWHPGQPDADLNLVQALAKLSADLCSAEVQQTEQALALCWLLHLLGDLHQPLHTVSLYSAGAFANGDRGGNDLLVRGSTNLHTLWDAALGGDRRWGRVTAMAAQYRIAASADSAVDIRQWTRDSRDLAARAAYSDAVRSAVAAAPVDGPVRIGIDSAYRTLMYSTAGTQMGLAGSRIAQVIAPLLSGTVESRCRRAVLAF
jgi:S1/P1 Nuclease